MKQVLAQTARSTIVLDTSVLLADAEALDAFAGSDIVIPLTVIEELDRQKDRLDDVGHAARTAIRTLESLRVTHGGLAEPVDVGDDTTLQVKTNGLDRERVAHFGFDIAKADNRILAACLGLSSDGERPVTLVSNDAALRLKASQIGLDAADHVPTAVTDTDTHSAGWTSISVAPETVDAVYEHGSLGIGVDEQFAKLHDNEFAVATSGSQSVLIRRHGDAVRKLADGLSAYGLMPRSKEQRFALDLLLDEDVPVVALDGQAGTGKTLLALAAALAQVAPNRGAHARYERLAVFRPMVSVEKNQLGFLPGDLDEKLAPWMEAITDTMSALVGNYGQAKRLIDDLGRDGRISFNPVTFLRGRTLHNTFVLVDEAQNLEPSTLKTILTRIGQGSTICFTGDTDQIDHSYLSKQNNALSVLRSRFAGQSCFGHVRLTSCERSTVAALAGDLL